MKKVTTLLVSSLFLLGACCSKNTKTQETMSNISQATVDKTVKQLSDKYPDQSERIQRSIPQVAALWQNTDGNEDDFNNFCTEQFIGNSDE